MPTRPAVSGFVRTCVNVCPAAESTTSPRRVGFPVTVHRFGPVVEIVVEQGEQARNLRQRGDGGTRQRHLVGPGRPQTERVGVETEQFAGQSLAAAQDDEMTRPDTKRRRGADGRRQQNACQERAAKRTHQIVHLIV